MPYAQTSRAVTTPSTRARQTQPAMTGTTTDLQSMNRITGFGSSPWGSSPQQRSMSYGMARRNPDEVTLPAFDPEIDSPRFLKKDETAISTVLLVILVVALVGLGGLSLWLLMRKKK